MRIVSWVLFEGQSLSDAFRRLACHRNTGESFMKAYQESGEWWPDKVIRNRHADNVMFDAVFLKEVNAAVQSDPE